MFSLHVQSYRKLSLVLHPDKNKADNATEAFRLLNKAYEVLSNNDSRSLFDYYLDHPRVRVFLLFAQCGLLLM